MSADGSVIPPQVPLTPALEASALTRAFGARRAVHDVSLALQAGQCLALFGPNGAGKTTLLRMLAGLLKPTGGSARIHGRDLRAEGGNSARSLVGLISHQSMLYSALSARENVEFAAKLHGLPDPHGAAERSLASMRVLDRADAPVRSLSRGLQQRVSIARATVHQPRVVLLDEPYTGLDEAGAVALTSQLQSLRASGAALVLVTHNVAEGLAIATHAAMMIAGRIARLDARDTLDADAYHREYREVVVHA
ncbi:MAG: ccmA [Gemmatimonadetes bacterium]|nr:ccmA [Gemmatimonadota bacterium]